MKLSTESILTGVYGIPATPVQRAACRARDGLPLGDLRDHPDVVAAFGGPEAVAALPSERGIKPTEFWNIASARTAKTTMACAGALADSQSIEATWGPGEVPRISLLSVTLDVADVPYRKLRAAFDHPAFRPLLVSERESDRMLVVRHAKSGLTEEIAVTAGGQAGAGLANRWCLGIIPDEAPKMNARADGRVTNLDDVLSVARERLLDGAQIDPIGSPWSPSGTAYDMVQTYFAKPTDEIVVMRTTGPAGNPSYWTPERLERLRAKDEVAWRINALGEFIDPEAGLLSPVSLRKNTPPERPLELLPEKRAFYGAAVDVGKGRWTLVVTEAFEAKDDLPAFKVALAREFITQSPDTAWKDIAAACARYGIRRCVVDQYAAAESGVIAKRQGLTLEERAWTGPNRLEAFTNLATLLHSDRIELSPERMLQRDLRAVKKRATQQGYTIVLPQTSDGRHCDFAPALAASIQASAQRCNTIDLSRWDVGMYSGDHEPRWPSRDHGRSGSMNERLGYR